MLYALIEKGMVENVITTDDPDFIVSLAAAHLTAVDITGVAIQPHIGWLYDGVNFIPKAPFIPPDMSRGLLITCESNPGLDGTYAVDAPSQTNINAIITYILVNSIFPNDAEELPWYDLDGEPHIFSVSEFETFATTVANYVASCAIYVNSLGASGDAPINQVTI